MRLPTWVVRIRSLLRFMCPAPHDLADTTSASLAPKFHRELEAGDGRSFLGGLHAALRRGSTWLELSSLGEDSVSWRRPRWSKSARPRSKLPAKACRGPSRNRAAGASS